MPESIWKMAEYNWFDMYVFDPIPWLIKKVTGATF